MGRPRKLPAISHSSDIPPLMACDEWSELSRRLGLPPQQAAIVELILHGKRDKQIALCLDLSHSTVRTHLRLIFGRFNVTDRVELILRIADIRGKSLARMTSSKLMKSKLITSNLPNCTVPQQ